MRFILVLNTFTAMYHYQVEVVIGHTLTSKLINFSRHTTGNWFWLAKVRISKKSNCGTAHDKFQISFLKAVNDEQSDELDEEPSYDAKLLQFFIYSDKYENEAAACCSTILVRGTDIDGIFIKNSTLINGRPVFVNQFKGTFYERSERPRKFKLIFFFKKIQIQS